MRYFCSITYQVVYRLLKGSDVRKITVDTGETDIGDVIQSFQLLHDHIADDPAWYFRLAHLVKLSFYIIGELIHSAGGQRSFFASLVKSRQKLVLIKFLPSLVFLDNKEAGRLISFVGGKARFALQTLPPPAYAIIYVTGVQNL